MRRIPLTPLGWAVIIAAALCVAAGLWLAWIEFLVVGLGLILALLTALPFVLGGKGLRIERHVVPERVQVGGHASSRLEMFNDGKSPSAPRSVEDLIGDNVVRIDVPAILPGDSSTSVTTLPTARRQLLEVGPAMVTRSDPLGLMRIELGRTDIDQLWVHPCYTALASARAGFAKDLEGPTFDNSPAGDVAFHTIREYQRGDDIRHIHWMSTARTGNLMVRHFVDNRRPHLAVLVDDRTKSMNADQFESAIEVAASQIVSAEVDRRPVVVWVGSQQVVSKQNPADRQTALDRLCVSAQSEDITSHESLYQQLRVRDRDVSTLFYVTGALPAAELLPIVLEAGRHGQVIIVRMVSVGEPTIKVPGAQVLDASDLKSFARLWEGMFR